MVKGLLTRQKLQNSKSYTESPEFSPALGLIIFGEEVCSYKFEVNKITSSQFFFVHTYYIILTT